MDKIVCKILICISFFLLILKISYGACFYEAEYDYNGALIKFFLMNNDVKENLFDLTLGQLGSVGIDEVSFVRSHPVLTNGTHFIVPHVSNLTGDDKLYIFYRAFNGEKWDSFSVDLEAEALCDELPDGAVVVNRLGYMTRLPGRYGYVISDAVVEDNILYIAINPINYENLRFGDGGYYFGDTFIPSYVIKCDLSSKSCSRFSTMTLDCVDTGDECWRAAFGDVSRARFYKIFHIQDSRVISFVRFFGSWNSFIGGIVYGNFLKVVSGLDLPDSPRCAVCGGSLVQWADCPLYDYLPPPNDYFPTIKMGDYDFVHIPLQYIPSLKGVVGMVEYTSAVYGSLPRSYPVIITNLSSWDTKKLRIDDWGKKIIPTNTKSDIIYYEDKNSGLLYAINATDIISSSSCDAGQECILGGTKLENVFKSGTKLENVFKESTAVNRIIYDDPLNGPFYLYYESDSTYSGIPPHRILVGECEKKNQ